MRKWIGLVGKAGVGKDYTYGELFDIDSRAARIALADGVRRDIEEALTKGVHIEALWEKPYPVEIRRLMQWWGTEFRRGQDIDYWVTKAEARVSEWTVGGWYPVFTDVRFENEAEMMRRHGGILVRVMASDAVRRERLGGELPPDHASETEQDAIQCDWQIVSEEGNEVYEETLYGILIDSGFKGVRGPEITD